MTKTVWKMLILTVLAAVLSPAAWAREYQRPKNVQPSDIYERWHNGILTTIFWVGEPSVGEGWSCNNASAWDKSWVKSFGGTDHPKRRNGFRPASFTPKQNPFYVALPFNDLSSASKGDYVVSRFLNFWKEVGNQPRTTRSVCKNRWLAITYRGKTCYAQWQDVGPVHKDDHEYVFGFRTPKSHAIGMAGLDVSPAVRDYLDFPGSGRTNWRFIQDSELPAGPWLDIVTRD